MHGSTVAAVRAALQQCGGRPGDAIWLDPGAACDIPVESTDPDAALSATRAALGGLPVDAAVQPAAGRRKSILIADMESTVIQNEMLDELAELVGVRERVAEITARAMNGEVDFVGALRERVALLANLPAEALDQVRTRIAYSPGARELVATMRANGAHCVLISGGFDCFADPVAKALGFHAAVANRLEMADGRLTGQVVPPVLDRETKRRTLASVSQQQKTKAEATLAVGDGANDLPMLLAAGAGVAWRAKPAVAAAAPIRIDHGDLTALLFLQGYRGDEIAAS